MNSQKPTHTREPARELMGLVERGASLRSRRFFSDMRHAWPAIAVAIIASACLYWLVIFNAGRQDWHNLTYVVIALSCVPLVSVSLLVWLPRQDFPITSATFITAIVFNFVVAVLSGLRIPISFTGVLMTAPVIVFCVIYAAFRLRKARKERIAILDFPRAQEIAEQLGGNICILDRPTEDLSDIDRVVIDGEAHHTPEWSAFLTRLYMLGVKVTPWIRFLERRRDRVDVQSFDVLHLVYTPSQIYYSKLKRAIDVAAVIIIAPFAIPLCLLIGGYIRLVDGGPALFRQERCGYGDSTFVMVKFRTMVREAGEASARENDDRVVPSLRFLRQFRLDELPQLLNILRGDMSWIGPRPVSLPIARTLEAMFPQYSYRHLVRPGLTGWAQVSQGYASTMQEEAEKLAFDLYYVKRLSFDIDLLILLKTVRIILFRRGVR
jgi:lipopolysaccharide/colanic/teichoic acid biosynthesis glycosyltransferase